ncbi:MAG TPA: NADH-quinone oxidoreductase subunit H [Actinomycetota bacterium]|jgi:NADH-quinone oxidoreductase subunit H|nr:NADH-quinone oxidoreductase subunit H [Actinomycetota bacterium]
MTLFFVLAAAVKVLVAFGLLMLSVLFIIYAERKVLADMQARVGPNRWGPNGLLQTLADGVKLFFKEDFRPVSADKWTYLIAPMAGMVPAFLAFAVVPFGSHATIMGHRVDFIVSDLNIAILYFLAMGSLGVYGIVLAGWASGSKYPLLGGVRSSAQMISYEIAMGLSLVPVVLVTGSLSTLDIVQAQTGAIQNVTFFDGIPVLEQIAHLFRYVPNWYIWSQWPAFLIFLIAGIAETNRAPFDLPEAETELVAGYHTEYSGIKFAMFFLGEYIHVIVVSAMSVTLFFGGWDGPVFGFLPWLWPVLWFMLKTAAFIYFFFWLRATLPRLRYDRLMWLGWKRLIPAALGWIVVTAIVNTPGIGRGVRLGVFAAIFVVVLLWAGRGDPRLAGAATPQRRVRRGAA